MPENSYYPDAEQTQCLTFEVIERFRFEDKLTSLIRVLPEEQQELFNPVFLYNKLNESQRQVILQDAIASAARPESLKVVLDNAVSWAQAAFQKQMIGQTATRVAVGEEAPVQDADGFLEGLGIQTEEGGTSSPVVTKETPGSEQLTPESHSEAYQPEMEALLPGGPVSYETFRRWFDHERRTEAGETGILMLRPESAVRSILNEVTNRHAKELKDNFLGNKALTKKDIQDLMNFADAQRQRRAWTPHVDQTALRTELERGFQPIDLSKTPLHERSETFDNFPINLVTSIRFAQSTKWETKELPDSAQPKNVLELIEHFPVEGSRIQIGREVPLLSSELLAKTEPEKLIHVAVDELRIGELPNGNVGAEIVISDRHMKSLASLIGALVRKAAPVKLSASTVTVY